MNEQHKTRIGQYKAEIILIVLMTLIAVVLDLPPENSTSCNWSTGMIELDETGEILCEVNGLKRIG